MKLYRLSATRYAQDLSGEGARLHGGRWNHIGTACLYTAESRSLAILEYSVNADLHLIPRALSMITLIVPDNSLKTCTIAELPGDWRDAPASNSSKDFGTALLQQNEFLLIQIPSVVVPQECNYLINPKHALMREVKVEAVEDFVYDMRIKE